MFRLSIHHGWHQNTDTASSFLPLWHTLSNARHLRSLTLCVRACVCVYHFSWLASMNTYCTREACVNLTDCLLWDMCVCVCVCVFPHTHRCWKAMQCCLRDMHNNTALRLSSHTAIGVKGNPPHTNTPMRHMEYLCWQGREWGLLHYNSNKPSLVNVCHLTEVFDPLQEALIKEFVADGYTLYRS